MAKPLGLRRGFCLEPVGGLVGSACIDRIPVKSSLLEVGGSTTCEERKKTKSQKCILAPVRQGLIFCFLQHLFLGQRSELPQPLCKNRSFSLGFLVARDVCGLADGAGNRRVPLSCLGRRNRTLVSADACRCSGRSPARSTPVLIRIFIATIIGS